MSTSAPISVVQSGLILCLDAGNTKSYSGSGTSWLDLSRNNNNGTLTNGPTYSSLNGGGIVFDGVNDYVLTPLNIDTNPNSVSAWCYPYDTSSTNGRGIVLTDNGGWDKGIEFNGGNWAIHNGTNIAGTGVAAAANTWYNCCVVYATDNIYLYVNGKKIWTAGGPAGATSGSTIEIGRANWPSGAGTRFYTGIISVVMAYNRVLTDSEILQNYNATKSRFGL